MRTAHTARSLQLLAHVLIVTGVTLNAVGVPATASDPSPASDATADPPQTFEKKVDARAPGRWVAFRRLLDGESTAEALELGDVAMADYLEPLPDAAAEDKARKPLVALVSAEQRLRQPALGSSSNPRPDGIEARDARVTSDRPGGQDKPRLDRYPTPRPLNARTEARPLERISDLLDQTQPRHPLQISIRNRNPRGGTPSTGWTSAPGKNAVAPQLKPEEIVQMYRTNSRQLWHQGSLLPNWGRWSRRPAPAR